MTTTESRFDLSTHGGRENYRRWLRTVLSESASAWDDIEDLDGLPFEEYFEPYRANGLLFNDLSLEQAIVQDSEQAVSIYEEVRDEVVAETRGELHDYDEMYDYDEAMEDAAQRIENEGNSFATYDYPIGVIFEGEEDEAVVTMTVSAEMTSEYSPLDDEYVGTGARSYLETRDPSPISTFLVGDDMDSGSAWMETACMAAGEMNWTFDDLMHASGVRYDTAEFGGDVHFYFDEDEARPNIERALLSRFNEKKDAGANPSSLDDLSDLLL